jgi:hypothetical protein
VETIRDLITTIDRLPEAERDLAVVDLEAILELREGPREVALGLLALDLVPAAGLGGATQLTPC